jgi:class 3 adenylate cyclase
MHKEFKELLADATGIAEYVIVINLDIRGFSSFCQEVDSLDVATFISKVYTKLLDEYFEIASYYKPTGDGLIVIIPYEEENLIERVNATVNACMKIVDVFSSLVKGDKMINFSTPEKIGIGIARGSACCIYNKKEKEVIDYSGRILNLASRLMDMARPSGIVFDANLGNNLLEKVIQEKFSEEMVYVRGVAELKPRKVYYSKDYTIIPPQFKEPIQEPKWETDAMNRSVKSIENAKFNAYTLTLRKKPLDTKKVNVKISYPEEEGISFWDFDITDEIIEIESRAGKYKVNISRDILWTRYLENRNLPPDTRITMEVTYPVKK